MLTNIYHRNMLLYLNCIIIGEWCKCLFMENCRYVPTYTEIPLQHIVGMEICPKSRDSCNGLFCFECGKDIGMLFGFSDGKKKGKDKW